MSTNPKLQGTQMLKDLEEYFSRYAALPPHLPLVLALWSVGTHLFDSFDCFPYLAITSPTKRCGKTRIAELLEFVCANPLRTVGISPAALFRTIEKDKPTLLIDEAESLRSRDERAVALREVLNGGYRKGQKVIRCTGNGNYEPQKFETFCPKVLVLIGPLPDTLTDRCIPVQMKRRTGQQLGRFRFEQVKRATEPVREKLKQWTSENRTAVQRWYEANDLTLLEDREAELWLPLFAVCAVAAPERLPESDRIALQLARVKSASESSDLGIKLLADIRAIFADAKCESSLPTALLLTKLKEIQESPWADWSCGRGLNDRSLSKLLRPFDVAPKTVRFGPFEVKRGYERADFEDAWRCYLLADATSATEPSNQSDSQDSASVTQPLCSGQQNEENTNVYAACSGVADENLP